MAKDIEVSGRVQRLVSRPPQRMRWSRAGVSVFGAELQGRAGTPGDRLGELADRELEGSDEDRVAGVTGIRRGMVTRFSHKSRRRMVMEFHRLAGALLHAVHSRSVAFVSLTYGKRPPEPVEAKRHLNVWHDRHLFPKGRRSRDIEARAALWVFELQKRGAPHFHELVFGPRVLTADWGGAATERWIHLTGDGGSSRADRRRYAVDVRPVDEDAIIAVGLCMYLAKEVTKSSQKRGEWVREGAERLGRFWGIGNRGEYESLVAEHYESDERELTREEAEEVSRRMQVLSEARMPDGLLYHKHPGGEGLGRLGEGGHFVRVGFDALGLPGEYVRTGESAVLERIVNAARRYHCSRYGFVPLKMKSKV